MDTALLTISELARFAGVTVRAVRHYHARGLLPEPPRDASGYRRYDAQAVVDLIRIRTLAEAGVPLVRVEELLRADPAEFDAAIDAIDAQLRDEIARLRRHRTRIARLAAGDSLALPKPVVDYLHRLRALGFSERTIETERDGWILIAAHTPEKIAYWISLKMADLDDEEYVEMFRRVDEASSWDPDDERLAAVADSMVAYQRRVDARHDAEHDASVDGVFDEPLRALLDSQPRRASPAWRRLLVLLTERGWRSWTNVATS